MSFDIFELKFYQDKNKCKYSLIPIENYKNDSDKVVDLLLYKIHFALIENLNVFQGDHNKSFICRRCLNSCTSENMLMIHKPKREINDITTIRTSDETRLHGKNPFHKSPIYFRIYADFEADHEIDNSSIGNKTTNIYKQNPVLNSYYVESELEDVLKNGFHNSPLGYKTVD